MAGSISNKDKLRLVTLAQRGYISGPKDTEACLNLALISTFMPHDRDFIEAVFDRLYKYYPDKFKQQMEIHKETL